VAPKVAWQKSSSNTRAAFYDDNKYFHKRSSEAKENHITTFSPVV